jgi:hypothetical protein
MTKRTAIRQPVVLHTQNSAARRLNVVPETFRQHVLRGDITPAFTTTTGISLFLPDDVDALKATREAEHGR